MKQLFVARVTPITTLVLVLMDASSGSLRAQPLQPQPRRYRIMAGAALNSVNPFDDDLGTDLGPGLVVRGVPRRGFRPVFDLTSAKVDLKRSRDRRELGELRVRAVLGGIGYTLQNGRFATTFAAAMGYAFNEAKTRQDVIDRDRAQFDVSNGPLLRTGVTLTFSAGSRVALVSSLASLFLNPDVSLKSTDSRQAQVSEVGTWPAHALVWQVGVAYKVF